MDGLRGRRRTRGAGGGGRRFLGRTRAGARVLEEGERGRGVSVLGRLPSPEPPLPYQGLGVLASPLGLQAGLGSVVRPVAPVHAADASVRGLLETPKVFNLHQFTSFGSCPTDWPVIPGRPARGTRALKDLWRKGWKEKLLLNRTRNKVAAIMGRLLQRFSLAGKLAPASPLILKGFNGTERQFLLDSKKGSRASNLDVPDEEPGPTQDKSANVH